MRYLALVWVFACALASASACTVLIDPETSAPKCAAGDGARDPCPEGFQCRKGSCAKISAPEVCGDRLDNDSDGQADERDADGQDICGDGLDNDCDGVIDEDAALDRPETCGNALDDDCDGKFDEGHDQDGDGNQWCGDTTRPGGDKFADCDDYNPAVSSGAAELCDGLDNNCNGTVDEKDSSEPLCEKNQECVEQRCVVPSCAIEGSSEACRAGDMCDLDSGSCVPKGCDDTSCPEGQYCDKTSGDCRKTRRENGEPCTANDDCASASCIIAAALRLTAAVERVCGQACCTDQECKSGERCFVSGSGARSCLPTSLVPAPESAPSLCTLDLQCGDTEVCAIVPDLPVIGPAVEARVDLITSACKAVSGSAGRVGDFCGADSDCASNACVPGPLVFFSSPLCSPICRTSADCKPFADDAARNFGPTRSYCRYLDGGTSRPSGDFVPVCVIDRGETGNGAFGAKCASGANCLDGACVGASSETTGYCAPTCCNDSQCPALEGGGSFCRPVASGTHYEMRCVR